MAAKKKNKKKSTSPKKSSVKKRKPAKKQAARKTTSKKKAPKKAVRKAVAVKKAARKKTVTRKSVSLKKRPRKAVPLDNVVAFQRGSSRADSGGQSGDLQGLSGSARSNSESVDELLEEGNAFEAEAVAGVENAGNADEEEVHTHEVPEDDVPEEYLDKD